LALQFSFRIGTARVGGSDVMLMKNELDGESEQKKVFQSLGLV
jgi:hypothetical protein